MRTILWIMAGALVAIVLGLAAIRVELPRNENEELLTVVVILSSVVLFVICVLAAIVRKLSDWGEKELRKRGLIPPRKT